MGEYRRVITEDKNFDINVTVPAPYLPPVEWKRPAPVRQARYQKPDEGDIQLIGQRLFSPCAFGFLLAFNQLNSISALQHGYTDSHVFTFWQTIGRMAGLSGVLPLSTTSRAASLNLSRLKLVSPLIELAM